MSYTYLSLGSFFICHYHPHIEAFCYRTGVLFHLSLYFPANTVIELELQKLNQIACHDQCTQRPTYITLYFYLGAKQFVFDFSLPVYRDNN